MRGEVVSVSEQLHSQESGASKNRSAFGDLTNQEQRGNLPGRSTEKASLKQIRVAVNVHILKYYPKVKLTRTCCAR